MSSGRGVLLALMGLAVAGCSFGRTPGPFGPPTAAPLPTIQVLVFAAASLRGALAEADNLWAPTPHVGLVISTDSSATLATQIELGAPADLFLSADTSNPQRLVDKGLTFGPPVDFAANKLTIIVPAANPAGIRSPADLVRPGLRIIAAGDTVPISRYAAQVVDNLERQPGSPAGFGAGYSANVRSKEDNVRAILAKIELGEGDAAIVYVTDARSSTRVQVVDLPDSANVPARYAGVVVKGGLDDTHGRVFLDWLIGPEGQALLARHGFLPPD